MRMAMRPARGRKALLLAGATVLAIIGTSAEAQDAQANKSDGRADDVILVTAQFRQQDLQDTPLAITAVNAEMLEARSQTDLSQVANQAPSVTLKPQSNIYGNSLAAQIRGVGQFDYNPALEPGVGIYVDDVYYATLPGSVLDLLDLDRVEILRGPQGTLAGRNSIGGAVKLYSQKPTGDNSGYAQGTFGSRNRIDLRAGMDVGLAEGVSFRLAGVGKWQDGYVDRIDYGCAHPGEGVPPLVGSETNCLLAREGEVSTQAFRAQLRLEPSDNIEISIAGDYTHEDHTVAGEVLKIAHYTGSLDINPFPTPVPFDDRFICGRFCNYANFIDPADGSRPLVTADGRVKFDGWGLSGNIAWQLSDDIALTSITAYRAYDAHFPTDADLSPLAHTLGVTDIDFWSFSQELRLSGKVDNLLDWTLGGFYMDQRSLAYSFQDLRYSPLPVFQQNDPVNADTIAAFANLELHATDKLSVIGGIRYTDEHKDYTFVRLLPDGSVQNAAINGQVGIYDHDRFDYRAAVQYRFTRNFMAYAQYSTGFKGGGVNPRPFTAAQVQPFAPETLTSYEIGFKSDLLDRRVRLNVAAYYADYDGIQLTLSTCPQFGGPGPCALVTNAGDGTIKGFEIETVLEPVDGLTIDGSLSYLDFQYKNINPQAGGPSLPNGPQLTDLPPYVPEWKWSVGAQYQIQLGDGDTLTPRFDATFQGDIYSNAANRPSNLIDDYILANARMTYHMAKMDFDISLEVTNLFDKYYYLTNRDQTLGTGGISTSQPGHPREWALSVKKRF